MSTYNDFIDLAMERYSCRQYSDKPVDKKTILEVLEAARIAPSACNKQPWTFYVVSGKETQQKINECYDREWFSKAPVHIVAVGDHSKSWHRTDFDGKDHADIDIAIAVEHLCLAATACGLGTCWVCHFDVEKCRKALELSSDEEPIAIIPIGYPQTEKLPAKNRKQIDEIVKWCDR